MTAILRSERARHASRPSASARSAWIERSWNSSSTIVLKPARNGSDWRRAVRIPSVATSTRVRAVKRRSNRTCQPTSSPSVQPFSAAIRAASDRAARRRGWRTIAGPTSATAGGTRVVFPAPGSAVSTSAPHSLTARTISGRRGSIGSGRRSPLTSNPRLASSQPYRIEPSPARIMERGRNHRNFLSLAGQRLIQTCSRGLCLFARLLFNRHDPSPIPPDSAGFARW